MADDVDLGAILGSPLDEPETGGAWWPLVVGIGLGALAVVGGYAVAGGGDADVVTTTTTLAPTTTTRGVDPAEVSFPPGYEPLTDVVALAPVSAVVVEDELVVGVSFVTRRGFDPEGAVLGSGAWVLETETGQTVVSSGSVFDPLTPGVFSVVFPDPGEAGLRAMRMTERWQPDTRSIAATVAAQGLPGSLPGPVDIDLGGETTLIITRLDVGERTADLEWELTGTPRGGDVRLGIRVQEDGADLAPYFPSPGLFFTPHALDIDLSGAISLQRDQNAAADLAAATTVLIEGEVTLVTALPADLTFDVTEMPIAGR